MEARDERPWTVRLLARLEARPGGGPARILGPLGSLYGWVGAARVRWGGRPALPHPPWTIAVGNLRVGGTGKTPVVEDLARRLQRDGWRLAVLSRGYRAEGGGDEPEWMRERLGLPVVLDPDRGRGVARAARQGAQLVLLDDAFQSPVRADRSAVIVLEADLERPPRCLPAGPAREGSDALRRADVLMVRCESGPWPPESARWESFRWHARQKGVDRVLALRSVPQGLRSPDGAWVDRDGLGALGRTLLVSGLARPESFEADARALGLDVVGAVRWADHVNPGPGHRRTLERMVRRCEAEIVVCPEKNLRRVWRLAPSVPLLALRACLSWWPEDPLPSLALPRAPGYVDDDGRPL